jgi:hypothetical protein
MKCSNLRSVVLVVGLVSCALSARTTFATPSVYFDRDDATTFMTSYPASLAKFYQFTGTLSSYGVDNIEALDGFNPTLTFGATGITAVANNTLATSAPGFQIDTLALLESDAAGFPQANTTFTFNQLINAFGLYVIQAGDGANNNPTTFRLRNTVANTFVDVPVQVGPGWGTDNTYFLGIADGAPFNQVEIIETGDAADGQLYDNVVAGVPEPASLGVVGLSALALVRRRR